MRNVQHIVVTGAMAIALSLLAAGSAWAAWEPAKAVDNPGSSSQTAGATGSYVALTDGGDGISTAFFEQTMGTTNGYYAIRRGASDSAWGTPTAVSFPSSSISSTNPISAGADANGNAIGLAVQNAGGVPGTFDSTWSASASSPDAYKQLMSTAAAQGGVTDPAIAFDSSGVGYAVGGVGQGAASDEPIMISTYQNGDWSTPAPVVVQSPPSGTTTCTNTAITSVKGTPTGEICGQEPRLAVSPDGTVVIAYLVTVPGQIPSTNNEEVFAVRAPKGGVAASGAGAFTGINQITASGNTVPAMIPPGLGSASNTPPNFDVAIDGADAATIVDAESPTGGDLQVEATRWDASAIHGAATVSSANPPLGATEPRVVADATGDATIAWTESSSSSPPPADALLSSELISGKWSAPESITGSLDSPTNPQGYTVNTPPFSLAEDPAGNAYVVWTNGGGLQDAIRQPGKAWSAVDTISGVTGAIAGTERLATGLMGQADATVIGTSGSRSAALLAARFTTPVPPPAPNAPAPKPGPTATPPRPTVTKPSYRRCYARPVSRIERRRTRASRRGLTVAGAASEHTCLKASPAAQKRNRVVKVFVSIYQPLRGGRCRFLLRHGRLTRPLPCSRRIEFLAHGTTRWTLRLRINMPPGGYLIRSDAVDGFRRHQRHSAASVAHVRVRPSRQPKHRHRQRRTS